jgi:cytokinin dehydrogenase
MDSRWDRRLAVSVPEEEVFYLVALLRNSHTRSGQGLQHILEDNARILKLCDTLGCKQYFPTHERQAQWEHHFGSNWELFVEHKRTFDPHAILTPGQNIFRKCQSLLIAAT